MNLFEANRVLSVKLNQPLESLYRLPFYEYSIYKKIIVKEIESAGDGSTSTISQESFEIERARPKFPAADS
jgi:hypothetical protein